jgi:hypothetical protein
MSRGDNQPKLAEISPLITYEMPDCMVRSPVTACRLFKTATDTLFYDVPPLRAEFHEHDAAMEAKGEKLPSRIIEFDALSDPEGSLLLIDATVAPSIFDPPSVQRLQIAWIAGYPTA